MTRYARVFHCFWGGRPRRTRAGAPEPAQRVPLIHPVGSRRPADSVVGGRRTRMAGKNAAVHRIDLTTEIRAPMVRCFDLARSIDLHVGSVVGSGERAIAGTTSGLIGLGEHVTWRARHFGIRFEQTSQITAMQRPYHFRDQMLRGPFVSFEHDHWFEGVDDKTQMRDGLKFEAPLGRVGDWQAPSFCDGTSEVPRGAQQTDRTGG